MCVVSPGRQSDAAQGVRVALKKCRVHHREGKIKRSGGGTEKWEKCGLESDWGLERKGSLAVGERCWSLAAQGCAGGAGGNCVAQTI